MLEVAQLFDIFRSHSHDQNCNIIAWQCSLLIIEYHLPWTVNTILYMYWFFLHAYFLSRNTNFHILMISINLWFGAWKMNFKAFWGLGMQFSKINNFFHTTPIKLIVNYILMLNLELSYLLTLQLAALGICHSMHLHKYSW